MNKTQSTKKSKLNTIMYNKGFSHPIIAYEKQED